MAEESNSFTYDAFLSFRGEDTRFNFIGHLLTELEREGINTFFDGQNLRAGDDISPALSKAIEESKISVIVFSEKYATSTWCLNELVKIIECTKRSSNNKQLAFPIFYHVDPSDVRYQNKSYEKAMIDHENRFGKDSQKIKVWRSALSQIASKSGHLIDTGFENDHIEAIVKKVKANIAPKPLNIGKDPVGLEYRIEEVRSLLDMKPNDNNVCMLGIYGLGGIGKTELAKALYNKIAHQFDDACFLANVREKSNKNGLEDPQKTLMSEMFEESKSMLGSTSRGIEAIKHKFRKRKVLLVLDDVDEKEQLESLAGGCDWFGPGSRIIITTRDKGLIDHQNDYWKQPYEMKKLDDQHSLELFCQNAFGKSHPEKDYEIMCSCAVDYAKGLPLALKVIGSNLATKKGLKAWELALRDYERIPQKGIQAVLKVSYDALEPYAQSVFLDIACFFKGEKIEYVKKILEEFGATSNIDELVNKSLVTVEHDCLNMHDLIQEMGREIVKQEAISNLGKRSRLWFHEDVIDVLTDDSGSVEIQGIMLDPPKHIDIERWSDTAFKKMSSLRILIVRNTSFASGPKHLPNYLRLLEWEEYPSKSFPPEFHPKNIIVINLTRSRLILEEPFKKYSYLTHMDFSYNQSITEMPDLSEVKSLRELRLDNCGNLITVHESVGFLKYLFRLSASGCPKLRNFLQSMFLPSLEFLDLNLCVKLEHFPEIMDNMNKPLMIRMIQTSIKRLPDSIGKLTGLVSLETTSSRKLKYLPSSLFTLPYVSEFKFGGCSQLPQSFRRFFHDRSAANGHSTLKILYFENSGLLDEDLHTILICFPKLEELIASGSHFVSFSVCIKEFVSLTNLDVSDCWKLQKIPKCSNLIILNVYHCMMLVHITELPSTIQKVDARYCFSLSRETSDMLWDQVFKERRKLEIVMPKAEIPERFDCIGKEGNPCFWARRKFPIVALALVFESSDNRMAKHSHRELVELDLAINGRCVPRKGYHNFRIAANHVLICDLRLLFSEEEWLGLDALLLEHEWNAVQVSCETEPSIMPSCWGVFVYKQQGLITDNNMEEYVQFMCPDPNYSYLANKLPARVPTTRDPEQEQRRMIERSGLAEMFDELLKENSRDDRDYEDEDEEEEEEERESARFDLMRDAMEISTQARDLLEGRAVDYTFKSMPMLWPKTGKRYFHREAFSRIQPGEASTSTSGTHQGSSSKSEAERLLDLEMKIYKKGIINGLMEAKKSFPTLDVQATLNTVLITEAPLLTVQKLDVGGRLLDDENSIREWILRTIEEDGGDDEDNDPTNFDHEVNVVVGGGREASSSSHQGSDRDQQQEVNLKGIFMKRMVAGLLERSEGWTP